MNAKNYSGPQLAEALGRGEFRNVIAGVVRQSSREGFISFSLTDGREWCDLPTKSIVQAERIRMASSDGAHPGMKITLAEPTTDEGKIFRDLFLASMANLSAQLAAMRDAPRPPTVIARDDAPPDFPSPTGAWCCKRGKAYACGTTIDGGVLVCCSEWEPCTTMGPRAGGAVMH